MLFPLKANELQIFEVLFHILAAKNMLQVIIFFESDNFSC